ncbi:hypothetical protein DN752_13210 [Echinicola strongylocentroti]|uniref:Protein CR006 P-loop domain-containing protein n=1 Tax=Echinicola strongylocentroti TaxID=1795355 RepID=A0A2Z4IJ65_9BACT|nr:AAA family ATPase [Echinicola strongylocentroti]AWW31004.1 hypothetical protein DN752_13210 [Echinicola strongylocentroti]
MITRINKLKDFGVYKDFNRTGDLQDFEELNIIYGWNYSGKTTISRLFSFLNKELPSDFSDSTIELHRTDGSRISKENLSIPGRSVHVFNADFIEKNLKWDGESFEAIKVLLVGEDAIEAQDQINDYSSKIQKIEAIIKKLQLTISEGNNNISTKQTDRASEIKRVLQLVQTYTKTHLKPTFDSIRDDYESYILGNKEYTAELSKALVNESDRLPDNLSSINLHLSLSALKNEASTLLSHIPELTNTIEYFIKNPQVSTWVENGLPFLEKNENCHFCGNKITEERKSELLSHFSEDLKNHKRKIADLISRLNSKKASEINLSQTQFYSENQPSFIKFKDEINEGITLFNSDIERVILKLQKKSDSPFKPDTEPITFNYNEELITGSVKELNDIIETNNQTSKDLLEQKALSIEAIKKHLVAELIESLNLEEIQEKESIYLNRIEAFKKRSSEWKSEIEILEGTISEAQKGKEELNKLISKFLGRDEVQVEVKNIAGTERFVLQRGSQKARYLSEGEKTAIALSFFITTLQEVNNLDQAIVYIDDPISSLDSNHIFQVNAFIKELFFKKEDDNSPWKLLVKQLFISTHNFDFFNLLTELPLPAKKKKYFQTVRKGESESTFKNLPKSLQNYSSEYHYLFELLHKFHESEDKDDYPTLMGLPNAIRRFTELYTYSRLPTNKSATVDQRADKLWGAERSKRILKVLHYFSHANSITRIQGNSDLICDIENAVEDLITELKTDPLHYDELVKSLPKN